MDKYKIDFGFKIIILLFITFMSIFSLKKFEYGLEKELIEYTTIEEQKNVIYDALVECYAIEGAYPENLNHLRKYGIIMDRKTYDYEYTLEESYLLPQVLIRLR